MSFIQKLFTSRTNNADGSTYVGEEDRIWWDPVRNGFYRGDGHTPGGILIGTGSGSPGVNLVVSDTPPINPVEGLIWFDTTTGIEYQYINDGNSTQWVAVAVPTSTGQAGVSGFSGATGQAGVSGFSGGGGSVGGSTTQVQFNNAGAFAGSANLTVNLSTAALSSAAGITLSGSSAPFTLVADQGTSGYVMTSQGAGLTPAWAAGGGASDLSTELGTILAISLGTALP